MIVATVLPLLRKDAWWVRIFDFPRLQITVIIAVTLATYLIFKWDSSLAENLFLVAVSSCLIYQGYMMYPYTPLSGKQVQQSENVTSAWHDADRKQDILGVIVQRLTMRSMRPTPPPNN